jgi:hypothetical protein
VLPSVTSYIEIRALGHWLPTCGLVRGCNLSDNLFERLYLTAYKEFARTLDNDVSCAVAKVATCVCCPARWDKLLADQLRETINDA